MLLRVARDSAVPQIYLNSEVWKCSFTLVISFNKLCLVPSLYILYCSICCYGPWCQVSVRFFWETILDFPSFCFVYAPGPCSVLPYHHPKLPPKQESTALSSPSTCTPSSSPSLAWIVAAEKQWMDSPLTRCFHNQGEAGRNRWDRAWAE